MMARLVQRRSESERGLAMAPRPRLGASLRIPMLGSQIHIDDIVLLYYISGDADGTERVVLERGSRLADRVLGHKWERSRARLSRKAQNNFTIAFNSFGDWSGATCSTGRCGVRGAHERGELACTAHAAPRQGQPPHACAPSPTLSRTPAVFMCSCDLHSKQCLLSYGNLENIDNLSPWLRSPSLRRVVPPARLNF
ncbi:unnamed protein product [Colias eurytheme]|nr:unnamed protein product [Colias eurytheme]